MNTQPTSRNKNLLNNLLHAIDYIILIALIALLIAVILEGKDWGIIIALAGIFANLYTITMPSDKWSKGKIYIIRIAVLAIPIIYLTTDKKIAGESAPCPDNLQLLDKLENNWMDRHKKYITLNEDRLFTMDSLEVAREIKEENSKITDTIIENELFESNNCRNHYKKNLQALSGNTITAFFQNKRIKQSLCEGINRIIDTKSDRLIDLLFLNFNIDGNAEFVEFDTDKTHAQKLGQLKKILWGIIAGLDGHIRINRICKLEKDLNSQKITSIGFINYQ